MTDDLKSLEPFMHALADAAGAAILPYFRTALTADNKRSDGQFDPVTQGDRAGERAIRDLITARYPTHGIVGEEFGVTHGTSPVSWIIDPVDGTRAFMSGVPTWGTLIGAIHHGTPVLGVMDQPYTGERFCGGPAGATLTTPAGPQTIACRACETLSAAVMASTDPRMFATAAEQDAFQTLAETVKLLRYGGDCYNYAMVALGQIDLVVEARNQPYDILPLVPIIEAAGGVVSDWAGRPLRTGAAFTRSGGRTLAAGDARVHRAAVALLQGAA